MENAGFILTEQVDESTDGDELFNIANDAIVDISGRLMGISIFKDGEVASVSDEATDGTHFSLAFSDSFKIAFTRQKSSKEIQKSIKSSSLF